MSSDELGDRMKMYEEHLPQKVIPLLPVCARIDGRAFHSFTKGLAKPYDKRFCDLMVATTTYLTSETNANIGYTQSDEISLTWYSSNHKTQIFFDGRIAKMTSQLAAMATLFFNKNMVNFGFTDKYIDKWPTFDCRVWNVPNLCEAANVYVWREQDATRNSILMAGHANFSNNQLHGKKTDEIQEMLWKDKQINWNDYPSFFKRGTYIQRTKNLRPFTADEISSLPIKHEARTNPHLLVERTSYERKDWPQLTKIANRAEVLFFGVSPEFV